MAILGAIEDHLTKLEQEQKIHLIRSGEEVYEALRNIGVKPLNTLNPYKQYSEQIVNKLEGISKESLLYVIQAKVEESSDVARQVYQEILENIEENY